MNDSNGNGTKPPPHSLTIERGLLGACMVSPQVIEECFELVTAADFYSPAHGSVWASICRVWESGAICEAMLVADDLKRHDALGTIGGPGVLLEMVADAPVSVTAANYAHRIAGMAGMRRLVKLALDVKDAAMADHDLGPSGLVDLTHARLDELDMGVAQVPDTFVGSIEEFMDRPREDRKPWVIPGQLRKGHRIVFVAEEGVGKALALDTPVPTPTGWSTMGDLQPGDEVFGSGGRPARVVAATPTTEGRPCFSVRFSDGETIVSDENHQWATVDYNGRQNGKWDTRIRTTKTISETLRARGGHCVNHVIERTPVLEMPEADLPLDPYVLGVWLGDGSSSNGQITNGDPEVIQGVRAAGWETDTSNGLLWRIHRQSEDDAKLAKAKELVASGASVRHAERTVGVGRGAIASDDARGGRRSRTSSRASLGAVLRSMGLINNKHIPEVYLRASESQRRALLAGLLDTDGCMAERSVEVTFCTPALADTTVELIRTLGFRPSWTWSDATIYGRVVGRRCRIFFTADRSVFRLPRKRLNEGTRSKRSVNRYIDEVTPVPSVPVRCIQVDATDGIFLAGTTMVQTHNSLLLRQMALCVSQGVNPFMPQERVEPQRALVIDLENPDDAIEEQMNMILPTLRSAVAEEDWDSTRFGLLREPGGMNLRHRRDRALIEATLAAFRPDIVVAGPAYKMYELEGDRHETAVMEIQRAWDKWRTRFDFALVLEHHAPMSTGDGKGRNIRPSDTMLWLRWPEFGVSLKRDRQKDDDNVFKFGRWRGDRVKTLWPQSMRHGRGGELPWVFSWPTGTFTADRDSVAAEF